MGFLEGIENLMGGNKQEKPTVLDSHDQVDPAVELADIKERLLALESAEDSDDTREERRVLEARKENLENPVTDWGQK